MCTFSFENLFKEQLAEGIIAKLEDQQTISAYHMTQILLKVMAQ